MLRTRNSRWEPPGPTARTVKPHRCPCAGPLPAAALPPRLGEVPEGAPLFDEWAPSGDLDVQDEPGTHPARFEVQS